MTVKSAIKRTLISDSVNVFQFSYLYGHFHSFWASGGPLGGLGGPWLSRGGPLGPHEQLNLPTYPDPESGATASSIRQICAFLRSAKTITPKSKLMKEGTRVKVKKSVNVFVS